MKRSKQLRIGVVGGAAAAAVIGAVFVGTSSATVQSSDTTSLAAQALDDQASPEPTDAGQPTVSKYYLPVPPAAPVEAAAAGSSGGKSGSKRSKKLTKALKEKGDPFPVIAPIDGAPVTGSFGTTGPYWAVAHSGADISATTGTPVKAVVGGNIKSIFVHPSYGTVVRLVRKDGVEIWYCHLSKPLVLPGQHVDQGAVVGLVGATGNTTGPHLHLEVRVDHTPTDPLQFFLTTPGKPAAPPAWAYAYRQDPPAGSSIL